jgi:hypothetical protein
VAADPVQEWLAGLERSLREAPVAEVGPMLAYVAGRGVSIEEDELNAATRQAVLLLAAGGDPTRGLELDGRAVTALAETVDSSDRRLALMRGINELVGRSAELPLIRDTLFSLAAEPELAWRSFAAALLAEELGRDE